MELGIKCYDQIDPFHLNVVVKTGSDPDPRGSRELNWPKNRKNPNFHTPTNSKTPRKNILKKEEKNLETTLLIDPANEEAILLMMEMGIERTNYSKVKELSERFTKVCKNLCDKNEKILQDLKNLEPKNES